MAEFVDLLLLPRWLIPIEPEGVVLADRAVAVRGGRIVAVEPVSRALARFDAAQCVDLPDHVLIPGFVNTHTHAAMTLLRGYADDMSLMRWLNERIWPAEAKHASAAFVRDGTRLACAEMLRGGVTCFNDMYFYPKAAAEAVLDSGIRAALGLIAIEFPSTYANDADDYLTKGLECRDAFKGERCLSFCMAPHAPYTVSDETFRRIVTFADQLGLPIHLHLHETEHEIAESLTQYGLRPLERMRRLGVLGPNLIAVHAVHLEDHEIATMLALGCHISHCPTSNMKLASGVAPIARARRCGLNIALGTDGAASNNRLDMLQEMRHAALLAKVSSLDPTALSAHEVLRMATLGGATALGLDASIGSIEIGKEADLVAIRMSDFELAPCFDAASHLVYVAGREHVSHVWVAGGAKLAEGRLLQARNSELLELASMWHNRLTI